jgi:hypothetical protein
VQKSADCGRWHGVIVKGRQKAEESKLNVNLILKIHRNNTGFWYSLP